MKNLGVEKLLAQGKGGRRGSMILGLSLWALWDPSIITEAASAAAESEQDQVLVKRGLSQSPTDRKECRRGQ